MSDILDSKIIDTKIEAAKVTETPVSAAPEHSDIEVRAMAKGWRPKTEFSGPDEDFTEAGDFLRNFTWVREINKLKGTIEQQKRALDSLVEHNSKIEQVALSRAEAELQRKLEAAAVVGNVPEVTKISKEIVDFKAKTPATPRPTPPKPDYLVDFEARNSTWFQDVKDPIHAAMTAFAFSKDQETKDKHPGITVKDHLKMVEDAVKKEFPSQFGITPKVHVDAVEEHEEPRKVTSKVESSSGRISKSTKFTLEDLPKADRDLATLLKKTSKSFSEERFLEQYKTINKIS